MADVNRESLRRQLQQALPAMGGVPADARTNVAECLSHYLAELAKWNRAYNLTAVRDPQAMLTRHIYDSLSLLPYLRGSQVIDVGTGAGLPGLPLAICCPQKTFTLLDSNGKKVRFLQHTVAALALPNVSVVQARVEDFRPPRLYTSVVCRAFTSLADFVTHCAHLRAPDGILVAMKGKYPTDEIAGLPADWQVVAAHAVRVPELEGERHLLELQPGS